MSQEQEDRKADIASALIGMVIVVVAYAVEYFSG